MPEKRSRFVLVSQQALALATVVAVTAPAAGTITLDIVAPPSETSVNDVASGQLTGSLVASDPVSPDVAEVPIRGIDPSALRSLRGGSSDRVAKDPGLAVLTAPEPVTGFATIGVTWKGSTARDEDIVISVRSLKGGSWSQWQVVPYDSDHGPDPDSAEAEHARSGTDAVVVGDVSDVQVKAVTSSGEAPAGMRLALVDPGETSAPQVEAPAIDTATLASAETTSRESADAEATSKPEIYSRAQWGADERMRDKSSLHYFEVHAGFVHHTVNANGYTRAEVPSIIRGIYAYHTQSKGWSDIGYNFLVDRFGRIWEGRAGGVDRPVVGAHTLNYNENSFAMSAIGNFETVQPSKSLLDAYGRLFAWKLSLHGVDASSKNQRVSSTTFQAINGHRDAGQTACPGRYLYAELGTIRSLAAKYQKPFSGRARSTDLSGSRWPDLVVRDKATKRIYQVRTDGQIGFAKPTLARSGWNGIDLMTASRDLTGDGVADVVGRNASTKVTGIYPGDGLGGYRSAARTTKRFKNLDQLTAVGDLNDDGKNDLVGRKATDKGLYLYPGEDNGFFGKAALLSESWGSYDLTSGVGDFDGDGHADLIARAGKTLWLMRGTGRGRLAAAARLSGRWGKYDLITGLGDSTNDAHPDIVARVGKSKQTYIYPGTGKGGLAARLGPYSAFKDVNYLANGGQMTGTKDADLVGRTSAGRLVVFGNTGGRNLGRLVDTGAAFGDIDAILNVGDWNGDGAGDVMTRKADGKLLFYAGNGRGKFAPAVQSGTGFGSVKLLAAVGDITGDGFPDLMGQPAGGSMRIYPGNGASGLSASYVAHSAISSNDQIGVGLWDGDGSPDTMLRTSDGKLLVYRGNGPGGLTGAAQVGSDASRYDWMQGSGDADGDGNPDVIARQRSTGKLWLLPGRSGGGFDARRLIGEGFARFDLGG